MSRPPKRALVIAHEPDGLGGRIEERLTQRGFAVDTHVLTTDYESPADFEPLPDLDDYDLLVPMGSVRSLTDLAEIGPWVDLELAMIRTAHEDEVPVLGVCFGAQLIADALGGSVEVAPRTEIGWFEIDDGPDGPNPVGRGPWMEWHHDRFVPPPGAEVLAVTDVGPQLIRLGSTVGTQFHPEVDVEHVRGFLVSAPDDYLADIGVTREEMLADVDEHEEGNIERCYALVDWFLDEVAFPNGSAAAGG